jgi:hypothetical protein
MNLFLGCQSKADIKARYRSLSLLLHPDQNKGAAIAAEAFRQLTAEYQAALQAIRVDGYESHVEQGQKAYDRRTQKNGWRPQAQKDCWDWMERLSLSDRNAAKTMGKMLNPPAYGEDAYQWYWELKTAIEASRMAKPERKMATVGALPDFSNPLWVGEY